MTRGEKHTWSGGVRRVPVGPDSIVKEIDESVSFPCS